MGRSSEWLIEKNANAMICKLCGCDKKLVDAHVIPRSFFRIDPKERNPARLVTNVEGRYTQKIRKGVYDSTILCENCEHHFSVWDDYADDIFIKSWEKFEKITDSGNEIGYKLGSYDYSKLKLFFMSVLWRAGVSSLPMFSKVELGPVEPLLRASVLSSDPGNYNQFGVVLQAFDSTNVGILDPHSERFSNVRFYRFYLSHVIAFIKVDSRPLEDPFSYIAIGENRPLVIIKKDFLSSPERRLMRNLVLKDKNRPPKNL